MTIIDYYYEAYDEKRDVSISNCIFFSGFDNNRLFRTAARLEILDYRNLHDEFQKRCFVQSSSVLIHVDGKVEKINTDACSDSMHQCAGCAAYYKVFNDFEENNFSWTKLTFFSSKYYFVE